MEKLKPKAVIFDLGSTLIEYEFISWEELGSMCALKTFEFLKESGFDIPGYDKYFEIYENIKQTYRDTALETLKEWSIPQVAEDLFMELRIEFDDTLIEDFFQAYYAPVGEQLYAYDDTLATLSKIRERFPVIGLISNTIFPEEAHINELNKFGINSFLDFKIFSSTFGVRKPHADIFYHAANMAGYAPAECVYIGDRYLEDIVGPKNIGMAAILKVKKDREYPIEMPLATRKIRCLAELSEHIDL